MMTHRVGWVLALLAVLWLVVPIGQAQESDFDHLTEAARLTGSLSAYAYTFNFDTQMQTRQGVTLDSTLIGSGAVALSQPSPALTLSLIGHLNLNGQFVPVTLDGRVIDGIFYTAAEDGGRWRGVALAELLPLVRDIVLSRFLSPLDSRFADGELLSGAGQLPAVAAGIEQLGRQLAQTDLMPFVTLETRGSLEDDGVALAHYTATLAVGDLLASEAGAELLRAGLALAASTEQPPAWAEVVSYSTLMAAAFEGTTLTVDYYIGMDDAYLHRVSAALDLTLDLTRFQSNDVVELTAALDVRLSAFNEVAPIETPPNALIIGGLANALGIEQVPAAVQVEPAQQQISPEPILLDEPLTVELIPPDPVDLVYTGTAGEVVNIVVRSLEAPGTVDTTVEVLDADGVRLAFNDDHLTASADLQPFDSLIEQLELPADGDYLIRVTTFSGAAQGEVEVLIESFSAAETPEPADETALTTPEASASSSATSAVIDAEVPDGEAYQHTFQGAAGQILTLTARATTDELDPRLTLISPGGLVIAENDDHAGGDPQLSSFDARIDAVVLPESGTYTASVSGFAGTGGPFELIIAVEGDAPFVPDDTAVTLGIPQETEAVIERIGDRYIYPLEVAAGDVYSITVTALDPTFDPELYLYDADDSLITANSDHGTTDSTLAFSDARLNNVIFQQAGRYEVEILGWGDTTGRFVLSVTLVAQGAPLGAGASEVFLGEIEVNGRFRQTFEAQQGDYITLTARALTPGMDPQMVLIDPSGAILADNDDSGFFADSTLANYDARIAHFLIPAAGEYTVEVTGFRDSAGSFALTITTLR